MAGNPAWQAILLSAAVSQLHLLPARYLPAVGYPADDGKHGGERFL